MAGSLNKVCLIGNLGRDPEKRTLSSGNPVVSFGLATSDRWKDKMSGEQKERTEWHNVVCYNENICRVLEQYARKGSKLYVEGALRTRKWQTQEGQDRYTTEVVLENFNGTIVLLGDKPERTPPEREDYGTTRSRGEAPGEGRGGTGERASSGRQTYDLDDDIPF